MLNGLHSYSAAKADNRRVRRILYFKPWSIKNEVIINFLTFDETSNASQYFDISEMAPDGKARWKASIIEQLIPKNALKENASNQTALSSFNEAFNCNIAAGITVP